MGFSEHNPGESVRNITYLSILLNFLLAIVKALLGFLGGSSAVVADAVHSLSDLLSDLAVLIGVRFWVRPADESHPYGHQNIEALVSGGIGILLLISGLEFINRAYTVLVSPKIIEISLIAAIGPVVTIVVKELLYQRTCAIGRRENSAALISNAWHHRSDAFSSIPVLLVVCVGVLYPELARYADCLGTITVAVIIIRVSITIMKESTNQLLGGNAGQEMVNMIRDAALRCRGVEDIHRIRCIKNGSTIRTDFHLAISGRTELNQAHQIGIEVKREIQRSHARQIDILIHFDPSSVCQS